MSGALADHDEILRDAVAANGGQIVKSTGDGVHAAFVGAEAAFAPAHDAQVALDHARWPTTGPLRVRMGVHTGYAELRDGDYYGPTVNRAARLMAVAHGGQVVSSLATAELVRRRPARRLGPRVPRRAPPARPRPGRARVPAHGTRPRPRVRAAAVARRVPGQSRLAAHFARRTRARARFARHRDARVAAWSPSRASGESARPGSRCTWRRSS